MARSAFQLDAIACQVTRNTSPTDKTYLEMHAVDIFTLLCFIVPRPDDIFIEMSQLDEVTEPYLPTKVGALESRDTSYSGLDPLLMEPFVMIDSPFQQSHRGSRSAQVGILKQTWHDVVKDVRGVRWARGGLWFSFICWAGGLLAAIITIPLVGRNFGNLEEASACQPDGSFNIVGQYNAWKINGFFQITAGVGHLNFANAKIIDVCWDVVSGLLRSHFSPFQWTVFTRREHC